MAQFECPPKRLLNKGEMVKTNVAPQQGTVGKQIQCYQETLKMSDQLNASKNKQFKTRFNLFVSKKSSKKVKSNIKNLFKYVH